MKSLTSVVAYDLNHCIGKEGKVPWDLPEDRKHFVRVTKGHAIIMGRTTYESIGRPLPNRLNIVVTRQADYGFNVPPGVLVVHSLLEAIDLARLGLPADENAVSWPPDPDPRIIGGAQIYAQALSMTTRIYVTVVSTRVEGGDTFFPVLDSSWQVVESSATENAEYLTYERVNP